MMTSSSTVAAASNRITALLDRQRSSRLRDLLFAAALAVGFSLSLGALHHAAADAATPVAATATSTAAAT